MSFTPDNSAIKVTQDLQDALKNADASEISGIMSQARLSQGLVRPDWDPSFLIEVENTAAPRKFAKSITVDGQKRIFEAESELELERSIGDYFRALQGAQESNPARQQQQTTEQPRNERGQFVSAEDAAAKAELELQFKRGDISTSDYLQKSGAISDYLQKAGVPLEDLKAQIAQTQGQRSEQAWADAVEVFKERNPSWCGGEVNKNLIGQILIENQWIDAEDKVAALELAYNHARENNLLGENPDTTYARELSEAQSPEQINAVNHKFFGSGLFNR